MINDSFELCGRKIAVCGNTAADFLLIQPADEHEMQSVGRETEHMKKCGRFIFAAFNIKDRNRELSPWQAAAAWGNEPFGGEAEKTLSFICGSLVPCLKEKYLLSDSVKTVIGGYSLAALFALWAVYSSDDFYGAAAASPSVWFDGWNEFIAAGKPNAERIYLSLGKKEEKAKNRVMAAVGDNMRKMYALVEKQTDTVLEWNEGGHFCEPELRTARAFEWIMSGQARV